MRYNAADIMSLLGEVAKATDMTLGYASFKEIYSEMEDKMKKLPPFKERYLYKEVYQKLKKLKSAKAVIDLNQNNIEYVAKFLGFNNYDQFKKILTEPVHPILKKCLGNWYSYVRCNSGDEYVLISPVRITEKGREITMRLNGKQRIFEGVLKFEGNCIYCLLESKQDKNLHLVFNIGFVPEPQVLQGVFSGMSSAGDPIAGREILIRTEENFNKMENRRQSISEMLRSKSEEEKIIAKYFKEANQNILKGGKSSTYELTDLKKGNIP
jgi:hypothetical protein